MENTSHVMIVGKGAEEFARSQALEMVENNFFDTEMRLNQLKEAQSKKNGQQDHDHVPKSANKMGTVGAVCLDKLGNLAAATSTGGMTNKMSGRVGDVFFANQKKFLLFERTKNVKKKSPIIGSGTYANKNVAISCTGHGEKFISNVVAYDVVALMEYKGLSLKSASDFVIHKKLVENEGRGGFIAISKDGTFAMPFNTEGMLRGYIREGECEVEIY